jgi:ubiquitin-protein ligase/uncharacterized membrane protein YgcG
VVVSIPAVPCVESQNELTLSGYVEPEFHATAPPTPSHSVLSDASSDDVPLPRRRRDALTQALPSDATSAAAFQYDEVFTSAQAQAQTQSGYESPAVGSFAPGSFAHNVASLTTRLRSNGQVAQRSAATVQTPPSGATGSESAAQVDWNRDFQTLLELPERSWQEKLAKYEQLSALASDFLHVAITFGKIIISEKHLAPDAKTIRPAASLGGVAGGPKYVYHGIVFKFATDWQGLYRGDSNAMKAGANELRALMRYFGEQGLSVPLMALVDYRGYRLVAMSILPIVADGAARASTLVYGSATAGRTIVNSDEDFAQRMLHVARKINIKPHWCGLDGGAQRGWLAAPTDIEGHIGTDGKRYVLDFGRVFPPTYSAKVQQTYLYRHFRPEFVATYSKPLSSDMFSRFGGADNAQTHNREGVQATAHLLDVVVPRLAKKLDQTAADALQLAQLTELLHRSGVNMRYLGVVALHATVPHVRRLLTLEALARAAKNALRANWRASSSSRRSIGDGPFVDLALDVFNLCVRPPRANDVAATTFWAQMTAALVDDFEFSSQMPQIPSLSLLQHVPLLIERLCELTGVALTREARSELKSWAERAYGLPPPTPAPVDTVPVLSEAAFQFVTPDIHRLEVQVKHMNIVSLAEGIALSIRAFQSLTGASDMLDRSESRADVPLSASTWLAAAESGDADDLDEHGGDADHELAAAAAHHSATPTASGAARLFRLAMASFEAAVRSTPDMTRILNDYGGVLSRMARLTSGLDSLAHFEHAFAQFAKAQNLRAVLALAVSATRGSPVRRWRELSRLHALAQRCLGWLASRLGAAGVDSVAPLANRDAVLASSDGLFQMQDDDDNDDSNAAADDDDDDDAPRAKNINGGVIAGPVELRVSDSEGGLRRSIDFAAFNGHDPFESTAAPPTPSATPSLSNDSAASLSALFLREVTPHELRLCWTELCVARARCEVSSSMYAAAGSHFRAALACLVDSDLQSSYRRRTHALALVPRDLMTALATSGGAQAMSDFALAALFELLCASPTLAELDDAAVHAFGRSYIDAAWLDVVLRAVASADLSIKVFALHRCASLRLERDETLRLMGKAAGSVALPSLARLKLDSASLPRVAAIEPLLVFAAPVLRELAVQQLLAPSEVDALLGTLTRARLRVGFALRIEHAAVHGSTNWSGVSKTLGELHCASASGVGAIWRALVNDGSASMAALRTIDVSLTDIDDMALKLLARASPVLESLAASGCNALTDNAATFLCHEVSPTLRRLDLSHCFQLTFALLPDALEHLAKRAAELTDLRLAGLPGLSVEALLLALPHLTALRVLDVCLTPAAGEPRVAHALLACSRLRRLDFASLVARPPRGMPDMLADAVSSSTATTASAAVAPLRGSWLEALVRACPQLTALDIGGCAVDPVRLLLRTADEQRSALHAAPPQHTWRQLRLRGTALRNAVPFARALLGSSLQVLDLSAAATAASSRHGDEHTVGDECIEIITRSCPQLRQLMLAHCQALTDRGVAHVAERLHQLQLLDLTGCQCVTDVARLGVGCPLLERLSLRSATNVTAMSLCDAIAEGFKHVCFLDLSGCRLVDDSVLEAISIFLPSLVTLHLRHNKTSDPAVRRLMELRRDLSPSDSTSSSSSSSSLSASTSNLAAASASSASSSSSTAASALSSTAAAADSSSAASGGVMPSRTCLRTLQRDLKELQERPLVMASAAPLDNNMLEWHVNIAGPRDTPYAGGLFHFRLVFPPDYPASAPSCDVLSALPHPHVQRGKLCLDLFSDFASFFEARAAPREARATGWSSAYSVSSVILQMQTFLMGLEDCDHERDAVAACLQRIPDAVRQSLTYRCLQCGHCGREKSWPPLVADVGDASTASTTVVTGDSAVAAAAAASESAAATAVAPVKLEAVALDESAAVKTDAYLFAGAAQVTNPVDLMCFFRRYSFEDDVLGIGLVVVRDRTGTLKSIEPRLDLLSWLAFRDDKVRQDSRWQHFAHWLPIYINRDHGERAMPLCERALSVLVSGRDDSFTPWMALQVLPLLMKSMVLGFYSIDSTLHYSIRGLEIYFACHRWLIEFMRVYPALQERVDSIVTNFIADEAHRHKRAVPDLGEFLMLLSVSRYHWADVASAYMHENFDRNVLWFGRSEQTPEVRSLLASRGRRDPRVDDHRAQLAFEPTRTGRSLLMFQVVFLERVARPRGVSTERIAERYDALFGRVPVGLAEQLQTSARTIEMVGTWDEFFARVGITPPTRPALNEWLRNSVANHYRRGYDQNRGAGSGSSSSSSGGSSNSGGGSGGSPARAATTPTRANSQVCRDFLRGACKRGNQCRFLHTKAPNTPG